MTQKKDKTASSNLEDLVPVVREDLDLLKKLTLEAVQQCLEAEMEEAIGAGKGERTESRVSYRSGYYTRNLVTRVGKLELRVPQDRKGVFQTELFERYQRSEKALVSALAEMYVQGVSTRKVKEITEELCGHTFSASTISRSTQKLDGELEKFARRRLDEDYPYLIVDARYEKVREEGVIQSRAVFYRDRCELGRAALYPGRGNEQPGIREQLEGFSHWTEGARPARSRVCGQRQSRRSEVGHSGATAQRRLAALLCAFSAQRLGLPAPQRGRRLPHRIALDLSAAQSAGGSRGSGRLAEQMAGQVSQAVRLGGREH